MGNAGPVTVFVQHRCSIAKKVLTHADSRNERSWSGSFWRKAAVEVCILEFACCRWLELTQTSHWTDQHCRASRLMRRPKIPLLRLYKIWSHAG